jgi:hypothetical protein
MDQLHPRRYVFRGHACGVSGQIRRPAHHVLPVQGVSALPVTGGLSESSVGHKRLNDWVSFDAISTFAHGDYVNGEAGVATTRGEIAFDAAPVRTRIAASVHGLTILGRVHVAHAAIGIISDSSASQEEPLIHLEGNVIEGVRIDDAKLKITLAEGFYRECNTRKKLAARHAAGLTPEHAVLLMSLDGSAAPPAKFPEARGTVKCTLVQKIEWDGPAHGTAQILGHAVYVPGFGRLYFGEMYISAESRRLTMLRFQLGSDQGGEVVVAEGENGPQTWPPDGG